ncbi:MAG: bifunctional protein-serine/threonine kinase/phosphatase [Pseudomonadales bacterium]|nr:bifunctional protein-serine/threonine kinase/phosphatase [Pseudomonadales bacterium]
MDIEHLEGSLTVNVAQRSEAGVKEDNEDCIGVRVPEEPELTAKGIACVIADGVSAAEAGKEASETCVQNFLYDYYSTPDSWTVKTSAHKVLTALNRWLYAQGQSYIDAQKGYITTFSALVLKSQTAHIFHVGDTRIYLFRDGELEQITKDHTAFVAPGQSYLARALGIDVAVDIDYLSMPIQKGDLFLLTSDGIHDFISRKLLRDLVAENTTNLTLLCDKLIDSAANAKSHDNLSVQALTVTGMAVGSADDVYRKLSELPFPPFLEKGFILDGYEILEELHASSRSQLYRVKDTVSGQIMVMKTPSDNFSDDPAYIERLIMEEWVGSRIESDHVVKVIRPDRPRKFLYYLIEHVPGETLVGWMKKNPHPELTEVVRIIAQLIKGLRDFHRKETLHQDLKPDNIVLDADDNVKIIDFGSVFISGISEIQASIARDIILGTDEYAAPEYKLGRKSDDRSDMFSLAIIAYEMMTGMLPWGESFSRCQNVRDYSTLKYVPAYKHNPMVPIWIDGAIKKALSINSELRYDSFSEFLFDLTNPNSAFLEKEMRPLVERDSERFWKILSGVLLLGNIVLGYLLLI